MGMKHSLYLLRNQCLFSLSLVEWRCIAATIYNWWSTVLFCGKLLNSWLYSQPLVPLRVNDCPSNAFGAARLSVIASLSEEWGRWMKMSSAWADLTFVTRARPGDWRCCLTLRVRMNLMIDWKCMQVVYGPTSKSPKNFPPP